MKRIILGVIFCMGILNAEKIIIENEKNGFFSTVGSIELDVTEDKNFIEATVNRGTLRINDKSKSKRNYIYGIRLCLSEYTNKRWNTKICSQRYDINKNIRVKEIIQLNKHKFLIPNKKTKNQWYTIVIECKSGKRIGHCYIHHKDRSKTVRVPKIEYGISKEGKDKYYKYVKGRKIKITEIAYLNERIKILQKSNRELVNQVSNLKNNKNHSQEWYRKKYEDCKASLEVN